MRERFGRALFTSGTESVGGGETHPRMRERGLRGGRGIRLHVIGI